MPTYVYACKNCDHRFEQYQSFSEDSLRSCPECTRETLRKVFDSVGIVFKGPGFYSTDSGSTGTASSGATAASGGSDGSGESSSASGGTGASESSSASAGSSSASSSATPAAASAAS